MNLCPYCKKEIDVKLEHPVVVPDAVNRDDYIAMLRMECPDMSEDWYEQMAISASGNG